MKYDKIRLWELEQKVKALEAKVYKNKKITTTLAQQILLLKELGMLDAIITLDKSRTDKANILSLLLNASFDNVYDYIGEVEKPLSKSEIKTEYNYKALKKVFSQSNFEDLEHKIDRYLDKLRDASDKQHSKEINISK